VPFFTAVKGRQVRDHDRENWCGDVHRNSPLLANIVGSDPRRRARRVPFSLFFLFRDKETTSVNSLAEQALTSRFPSHAAVFFDRTGARSVRVDRAGPTPRRHRPGRPHRFRTIDGGAGPTRRDDAMETTFPASRSTRVQPTKRAGFPLWRDRDAPPPND